MSLPAANATIRRVDVGDLTLEIAETGVGGRPLLLLHGLTGAKEDFGDWWEPLAERGWHVVAPDLRGHGASDHPPRSEDYTLELFEADVLALVEDLGWDRFVLLGHSMGGMISQAIAVEHPERLDGLVLMDTVADAPELGGGAPMAILKVVMRVFGMKALARFLRKPPPGSPESVVRLYAERPGYVEWTQAKVLASSPTMARAMTADLGGRADRVPQLATLDLPVLVIVGEHDMPGFVDGSRRMAEAIPGATFALLEGAAHSPQLETPEAWWATLAGFLDGLADR
jgi:pimeloyl-ACP methyl ester carboxylesterase